MSLLSPSECVPMTHEQMIAAGFVRSASSESRDQCLYFASVDGMTVLAHAKTGTSIFMPDAEWEDLCARIRSGEVT